jgi:hypothetical protein
MLRTLLELHGRDGVVRLAKMTEPGHEHTLFVALSIDTVVQVQRLSRDQAIELVDVLDEWLFDTSLQGRPTVQPLNSPPAM